MLRSSIATSTATPIEAPRLRIRALIAAPSVRMRAGTVAKASVVSGGNTRPSPMPCRKPFQITRPSLTSSVNSVMSYNERPHRLSPIAISHRASTLPIRRDTMNIEIIVPMPRGAMTTPVVKTG